MIQTPTHNSNIIKLLLMSSLLLLTSGCFFNPDRIEDTPSPKSVCGNGIKESGEECDEGNKNGQGHCTTECKKNLIVPICGDGIVNQSNEECDAGKTGDQHCTSDCKKKTTTPQTPSRTPVCGDGVIEDGETCDDGNTTDGDGCNSSCQIETGATCYLSAEAPPPKVYLPVYIHKYTPTDAFANNAFSNSFKEDNCLNSSSVDPIRDTLVPVDTENGPNIHTNNQGKLARYVWAPAKSDNNKLPKCSSLFNNILSQWKPQTRKTTNTNDIYFERVIDFDLKNGDGDSDNAYKLYADNGTTGIAFYPLAGIIKKADAPVATCSVLTKPDPNVNTYSFDTVYPGSANIQEDEASKKYYTFELRAWFKYDKNINTTLTFNGDDDFWVFINGRKVLLRDKSGNVVPPTESNRNWGAHGIDTARQRTVILPKDAELYGLQNGQIYEIDYFLINREGVGNLTISLPPTLVGPSYCGKCGNGILDPGEECDTGAPACLENCKIALGYSCGMTLDHHSYCKK